MKRIIIATLILALYGCGGGGGGNSGSGTGGSGTGGSGTGGSGTIPPADPRQEIINLAYDATYTVPADFRQDREEEIHHLRYGPGYPQFEGNEFCHNQVRRYSEGINEDGFFDKVEQWATNNGGDMGSDELTNDEDDFYYETGVDLPTHTVYVRSFKCDRFTRTTATNTNPFSHQGGTLGDFNDLANVFEYLYTIRDWGDQTVKVLNTQSYDTIHELEIVIITPTAGSCDNVEVGFWTFDFVDGSNAILRNFVSSDEFNATDANGTPEVCS